MLFLRFMLLMVGFSLLAGAATLVLYDLYLALELKRFLPKRTGRADTNLPLTPRPQLLHAVKCQQFAGKLPGNFRS